MLILSSLHWDTNNPIESGDLGYSLRVIFESRQRFNQTILHRPQAVEDQVREPLFTDILPNVLHGIELRTVGRQGSSRIFSGICKSFARCHPAPSSTIRMSSWG